MTSASRNLSPEAARTSRERRVPLEPQPLLGDVKELPLALRPRRPVAWTAFGRPCQEPELWNSDSESFFGEQRFSAFTAVRPHSLQIGFGSLTNSISWVSLMLPGQQVIAHNLVSWEPVRVLGHIPIWLPPR